jgi:2-polyprenyl-3-methyl-5-hydroxy-6-metoxy-1,4-benzoquinol methylase
MAQAKNYFAWQSRLVAPELGRRVVEVGCGLGNFTRTLLNREAVIALDPERDCIERLVERYPNRPNLHALVCDAASHEFSDVARFQPDSCVCLNVLEHIPDDRKALAAMASVLPPGGAIVLLVPAFQALYGPIDWNLGHHRRYDRAAIAGLAQATGLLITKLHYVNFAGFFGWWLNSHIFRREAQSERQIAIFDTCLVPVLSRIEGLVRPPFGQSLFTVLRKP